jgi:hypothetical protein
MHVLGVGHHHRELGLGEPLVVVGPLAQLVVGRQRLEAAVEVADSLEPSQVPGMDVRHPGAWTGARSAPGSGPRCRRAPASATSSVIDEQLVALGDGELAGGDDLVEEDLEVDLVVRAVARQRRCRWRRC